MANYTQLQVEASVITRCDKVHNGETFKGRVVAIKHASYKQSEAFITAAECAEGASSATVEAAIVSKFITIEKETEPTVDVMTDEGVNGTTVGDLS